MKFLSLFFCLLIAVNARAASPAFNDFNLNQFGTNSTAGNKVQIKSGSLQSNNVFWASSSAIQMKGSDGTIGASFNTGTNFFAMVVREDKSLIISSNTLANLPTLLKGDIAFWSSNGTPYLITSASDGTLATNAMTSSGGVSSVGLAVSQTGLGLSGSPITSSGTITITSPSAVMTNGFTPAVNLGGVVTSTNSFLFRSNTLASIPTLIKGDVYFWSSNGTPYLIASSPAGVFSTNILMFPGNAGGGPFTNLTVFQGLWDTNVATGGFVRMTNGSVVFGGGNVAGTNASANINVGMDDTGTVWCGNGIVFGVVGTVVGTTDYIFGNGVARLGGGNITLDGNGYVTMKALNGGQGPGTNFNSLMVSNGTVTASSLSSGSNIFEVIGIAGDKLFEVASNEVVTVKSNLNVLNNAVVGGTLTVGGSGSIQAANSNFFNLAVVNGMAASTNLATMSPDFSKAISMISTNNAFQVLGYGNKDAIGKTYQWCTVAYTNSAGLGAAFVTNITFAANTHVIGLASLNLTNWTEVFYEYWPPNGPTNAFVVPCF